MNLTRNFKKKEFEISRSTGGHQNVIPDHLLSTVQVLAIHLQTVRDILQAPLIIVSGYRTSEYNTLVDGANKSYHMLGMAADIRSDLVPTGKIYATIYECMLDGRIIPGGLHMYGVRFVHYDIRGKITPF